MGRRVRPWSRPGVCSRRVAEPPCAAAMSATIGRPSPLPVESGPRTKRSKTCSSSSGGMPAPSSRTAMAVPAAARSTRSRRAAGARRSAARSRRGSRAPGGCGPGRPTIGVTPARPARGSRRPPRAPPRRSRRRRRCASTARSTCSRCSGSPPVSALRDRRDVADEPLERRGVLEDRAQVLVVARVDAVEHRLEPPAHDRERRAQLVRDVGEERAALRVDRAQARAHRVERARERAHVAAAALGHARGVVAVLDLRGRLDQRADRRHPPAHRARRARGSSRRRRRRIASATTRRPDGGRDRADGDERGPDARRDDAAHRQQQQREHQRRSAA